MDVKVDVVGDGDGDRVVVEMESGVVIDAEEMALAMLLVNLKTKIKHHWTLLVAVVGQDVPRR